MWQNLVAKISVVMSYILFGRTETGTEGSYQYYHINVLDFHPRDILCKTERVEERV